MNAMDFSQFRKVIDGWGAADQRGQFSSLYHNAGSSGTWMPARRVNRRRFEERFSTEGPSRALPVEMNVILNDVEIAPRAAWERTSGKGMEVPFSLA